MATTPAGPPGGLNVVALVSGGKDSFFSLLHCRANGHRVVALANLYPAGSNNSSGRGDGDGPPAAEDGDGGEETDLNSFMYQTVGHEVIPLYAEATGLPLYRQEIVGGAGSSGGRDYSAGEEGEGEDETESMVPLLRRVVTAHPEVDAVCAGAILSTYQRTRVESVALRLGLAPLAYLWKFPVLPAGLPGPGDDSRLLVDMADVGLEARIIKVASGGLDEGFLWEDVASLTGVDRLLRAMRRFGGAVPGSGAVIGEGGEFETLVIDGPVELFRKRIVVDAGDRSVVREGGGTAWLKVRKARVEEKNADDGKEYAQPRIPDLFDARFTGVLQGLHSSDDQGVQRASSLSPRSVLASYQSTGPSSLRQWRVVGDVLSAPSIEAETTSLVGNVRSLLNQASLLSTSIISTVIVLRRMADFPTINKIYGSLFTRPNPPSRITISCGDLLPPNCNIAVYLSVHHGLAPDMRQGLHVQSRSYWAPANIGPYSQAISVPISSLSPSDSTSATTSTASLVHIAGQIPLIPATMELAASSEPFEFSAALSLQHLWRIGTETGVQWWSSAVAYLPHSPADAASTRDRALLASRVWRAAHTWSPSDQEDDDEAGPDLWDRRHNPVYMSFAGDEANSQSRTLPDRSVLEAENGDDEAPIIPTFFAAEVQELPRQAGVEWHAHLGFARLDECSVRVIGGESEMMAFQHTIVSVDGTGLFIHTVLAVKMPGAEAEKMPVKVVLGELQTLYLARLAALVGMDVVKGLGDVAPTHVYVHTGAVGVAAGDVGLDGCPVIPCFSLWSGKGEELTAVAVYQEWLDRK
ncbi:Adenine nucleotide alpha hydrolases-like protein [Coniochaeta hoffmannii]|uniref:Diphthine--ammonia ligase n=1 Tax=Coniochaeta hoffmannii TaxID=91930 RepID=A0AA38RJU0_9PEZI|nr:Adenine nucleotide alpha hydrolases-like protein [Coniochaeta hoffmannii]